MPISVKCQCGAGFKAQDHLAGKNVKCPKCGGVISVPNPQPSTPDVTPGPVAAEHNPIMDLLDEAGVQASPTGPTCPACAEPMDAAAVICVHCGYNVATGEYLDTYVEIEQGSAAANTAGMTDAQKIMAKAEASIDDSPETAVGQDFGDGADSYVVAVGAVAILGFLVMVGVVVVLAMERFSEAVGMAVITFFGFLVMYLVVKLWITILAFMDGIEHGILCVLGTCLVIGEIYTAYFAFSRGLIWQGVVFVMAYLGLWIMNFVV